LSFKINNSKLGFFCGSIPTNDEHVLLTIKSKWLEAIVHMTKCEFLDLPHPKQVQLLISIWYMVSFACQRHLPLLAFKKTSNNLSHKWKLVWRAKLLLFLRQLFLMIMSNKVWNASLISLNQNQFLNKNPSYTLRLLITFMWHFYNYFSMWIIYICGNSLYQNFGLNCPYYIIIFIVFF